MITFDLLCMWVEAKASMEDHEAKIRRQNATNDFHFTIGTAQSGFFLTKTCQIAVQCAL